LSTQQSSGNALDEWKEARSVIARFDNNLHDLRKYGFSFVTALLAANGLLSQGGTSVVPLGVKTAVLMATMGLIVTLKLLDTHYRRFQTAASMRGRILEDRLNLDLTNDISFFYALDRWWRYVQGLYYGFVVLTALLGVAILWGKPFFIITILIAALVSGLLIYFINDEKVSRDFMALEDWSVDRKIVGKGSPVRITFTNLNVGDREPGTFKLWWNIRAEAKIGEAVLEPKDIKVVTVDLKYFENYDWLWKTEDVEPGLYELEMFSTRIRKEKQETLSITIESMGESRPGKPSAKLTIQVTPV